MYQNTVVLSFDDIRTILTYVKGSKEYISNLNVNPAFLTLDFLQEKKIYHFSTRSVTFSNAKHEVDKILFVFNSTSPSVSEVVNYYSGNENPLGKMPELRKALMYESNLSVSEALEVTKSLQLIQNLSMKEMKYYLGQISQRYSNLYVGMHLFS